jgi:predicted RNA methylase
MIQLEQCECDGSNLKLAGQLDRAQYVTVAKVLAAAGGKWNRKAQAHVFPYPAADVIDSIILTGEVVKPDDMGWFPTPPPVVRVLLDLAELRTGLRVLEPSAGEGAIASAVAALRCTVDCIEIEPRRAEKIPAGRLGEVRSISQGDFLAVEPPVMTRYDRVVMNPPFAKQADLAHVTHALKFLEPTDGLLVSVMSLGVTFRENKAARDFRDMVQWAGGRFVPLPGGSFKVAGTNVETVIAVIPA